MRGFRSFLAERSGNFTMITALLSVTLLTAVGLAVDYSRYSNMRAHLQELTDTAALALAASNEQDEKKLRQLALDFIESNRRSGRAPQAEIVGLKVTRDNVDLELQGVTPTTFMAIAGHERMTSRTSALAERAIKGNVEVALVLDNTWSMSDKDAKGKTKIDALKSAAGGLVDELMKSDDGAVKIGLVPYADYVNVGTQYRNAPWLSVPADYTTTPEPRTCERKVVTSTVCDRYSPYTQCTRVVDGVSETYQCRSCEQSHTVSEEKEVCSGGGSGTAYKWYGCVGSRMPADNRLHDKNPSVRYPGYVETSYKCPEPITTLTAKKAPLKSAIASMVISRGGTAYRPNTYIPAGLVWGLNVLSPEAPFEDAQAYDERNVRPRKVAVLMTDGVNTLQFRASDGRHVAFSGNATNQQKQRDKTDNDTKAICDYMKSKQIEIFSVAFMVNDTAAKAVLQYCASDPTHYYDASDSDALLAAFSGISSSLRVVRLAR